MSNAKIVATNERLPSYHESVSRAADRFELRRSSSFPDFDVDFEETKQHEKGVETTIMSHALTHDAKTLGQYLEAQGKRLPDPVLRVRGTHKSSYLADGYLRYGTRVDFDLTIPLQDQLAHRSHMKIVSNSRKAYRGTRTKTDSLSRDAEACSPLKSLDEWCREFCAYRKGPKRFTFARTVGALEKTIPIESIKQGLRDVKYKGNIEVTVEAEDQIMALASDHFLARLRLNGFYWFLCIISQLWLISWLFSKRWEILTIEWPTRSSQSPSTSREAGNMAAAWGDKWKLPIARAALYRLRERLHSAEMSAPGTRWKALGDFDEVQEWGVGD